MLKVDRDAQCRSDGLSCHLQPAERKPWVGVCHTGLVSSYVTGSCVTRTYLFVELLSLLVGHYVVYCPTGLQLYPHVQNSKRTLAA